MTIFDRQRLSFGAVAEHYDRSRPGYPRAALEWALAAAPAGTVDGSSGPVPSPSVSSPQHGRIVRVVDLGAGTGLLTRIALAAGFDVVPVEPDPGMRAQLDRSTPGVTALAGSAESVPLPDASVDAVIVGQAYHWFDPELAHPEIARVLRPGGVFAPIWNDREVSAGWTERLDEIITGGDRHGAVLPARLDFGPLFDTPEHAEFRHRTPMTPQGLADLVASRSYYLTATPQRRTELLEQVGRLCATQPELAGRDRFELPYVTVVHRAVKR